MTRQPDNDRQHIPAFNVVTPPLSLIINRREADAPLTEMVRRGKRGFISACLLPGGGPPRPPARYAGRRQTQFSWPSVGDD